MKHRTDYRTCPYCGANNDPGERCDCFDKKPETHATFTVTVNFIPGGGEAYDLSVFKQEGIAYELLSNFSGPEAEVIYNQLLKIHQPVPVGIASMERAILGPLHPAVREFDGACFDTVPKKEIMDNYTLTGIDLAGGPIIEISSQKERTGYYKDNNDSDMIGWGSKGVK